MKLSIITINYNNAQWLENTIRSIVSQGYTGFEYIVIDGASTDNSVEIIKKYADKIDYWLSEPDSGVYNAMNKGIEQAKGEYLLFINSGDTLYNNSVLSDVFSKKINSDLIYGDLHRVFPDGHDDIVPMPENINIQYMLGNTLAHPVTFIKRKLFEKYGLYREDLKIVSDWAFFLKIIAFGRITKTHIPLTIATFQMDGMSNNPDNETRLVKETDIVLKDYFSLDLLNTCTSYDKYYNFYHKKSITFLRKAAYFSKNMFFPSFWKNIVYQKRIKPIIKLSNKTVRQQKKDPLTIPIIIINYNRLADLEKLVFYLLELNHKNIVIVDNNSTYPPLLEYYERIKNKVTIKRMDKNYGHLVFWLNKDLYNEYSKGYHIVTDSDILPNINLPDDYIRQMMVVLDKHNEVTKVGFALRIDDLPEYYSQKKKVIDWESQFWANKISENIYKANLDTTFAIYPPRYTYLYDNFYNALRMGGNFTARHAGWYIDSENLTDEEKYYFKSSGDSNTWKLDENGNFTGNSSLYEK